MMLQPSILSNSFIPQGSKNPLPVCRNFCHKRIDSSRRCGHFGRRSPKRDCKRLIQAQGGSQAKVAEAFERVAVGIEERVTMAVKDEEYDAVVIGAGIGGLVAATQLAIRGARVMLLEKYVIPGGSSGYFQRDGYTFDVGSSVMFGFSDKVCTHRRPSSDFGSVFLVHSVLVSRSIQPISPKVSIVLYQNLCVICASFWLNLSAKYDSWKVWGFTDWFHFEVACFLDLIMVTLVTKLYTQVQWEQRSGAMGFGIGIHKPDNKVTGGSGAENGGNWRSCHSSLPPARWPLCAGPPGVWGVPCWTHQPLPPWGSRYPQLLYTMLEGLYPYLLSSMTIVFLDPKSLPNKWPFVLKIFTQRPNLWTFFVTAVWRLTGVHLLACLHVGGAFLCFWKLALWVCSLE